MSDDPRPLAPLRRGHEDPGAPAAYVVGPSGIHGSGLFAARPIAAGARIGEAAGPATRRDGPHVLWYEDEDGRERAIRITNDLRFANHARPGNAVFHGTELWASRAIAAGEEITLDYGPAW